MLYCKGRNCHYRDTCRRYRLGLLQAARSDMSARWLDHCSNTKRYEKFTPIENYIIRKTKS